MLTAILHDIFDTPRHLSDDPKPRDGPAWPPQPVDSLLSLLCGQQQGHDGHWASPPGVPPRSHKRTRPREWDNEINVSENNQQPTMNLIYKYLFRFRANLFTC